jgi:AraC-like DNA-binding protein
MKPRISASSLFFQEETPRPLGRLTLAGTLKNSGGVGSGERVFGLFALVILVEGEGFYRDARGKRCEVRAGDAILVFPELPHAYGPRPGGRWDEIYVCFDGAIFNCWRHENVLDITRTIHHLPDFEKAFFDLKNLLSEPRPATPSEHLSQIHRFLAFLGENLTFPVANNSQIEWLERAKIALGSNLSEGGALKIAALAAGQSYESFRKNFAREMGLSPSQFRDAKRLEAAKTLLLRAEMTNANIAQSLGFRDEAHFSRRFKQLAGQTARAFRQEIGTNKTAKTEN